MKDVPPTNSKSVKALNPHLYGGITSEGDQELQRAAALTEEAGGVANELDLHNEIIKHCCAQFPQWKYIHANPTVKSTIQVGAQDFTIFLPGRRTLCIECKSKDGKVDPDQRIWHKEMQMLGHDVHVIRSMEEFLKLVTNP